MISFHSWNHFQHCIYFVVFFFTFVQVGVFVFVLVFHAALAPFHHCCNRDVCSIMFRGFSFSCWLPNEWVYKYLCLRVCIFFSLLLSIIKLIFNVYWFCCILFFSFFIFFLFEQMLNTQFSLIIYILFCFNFVKRNFYYIFVTLDMIWWVF